MADEPTPSADELARLLDAALAVSRAAAISTPEALAALVLEHVFALVPCDQATFFLLDPLTDEMVRLAWLQRQPPEPARFARGVGAVGWAVANRAPLLLTDARRDPRFQPLRYPSTRSLLTVPLEWDNRVVGALACSGFAADAFRPSHMELLRRFGEHVAAALASSRGARGGDDDAGLIPARVLSEYAHEVRGPLHTALGFLSLALSQQGPPVADAVAQARLACQQALELADSVLDAAAQERQGLVSIPVSRPTELGALLRASAERVQGAAELRGVHLETELDTRPCLVAAPHKALERVLDNLLLNAVEHSPAQGKVRARAEAQGDRAVLMVEDEGPGIPEDHLDRIFTPFYRGGGGRRERSGGLGLTLALRTANQYGGRLWAENRAGGGARFVLQLPLVDATTAFSLSAQATSAAQ